jgi:hypothetical protein
LHLVDTHKKFYRESSGKYVCMLAVGSSNKGATFNCPLTRKLPTMHDFPGIQSSLKGLHAGSLPHELWQVSEHIVDAVIDADFLNEVDDGVYGPILAWCTRGVVLETRFDGMLIHCALLAAGEVIGFSHTQEELKMVSEGRRRADTSAWMHQVIDATLRYNTQNRATLSLTYFLCCFKSISTNASLKELLIILVERRSGAPKCWMNVKTTFELELDGKHAVMKTPTLLSATTGEKSYCSGDDCCALRSRVEAAFKTKFPQGHCCLADGAGDVYMVRHSSENDIYVTASTEGSGFSFQFAPAQEEMLRMYVANNPIEWFFRNGWDKYCNKFDIVLEQQFEANLRRSCESTVRRPGESVRVHVLRPLKQLNLLSLYQT